MKIALLTDSSSGLYNDESKNLFVMPLPIIFPDFKIYDDDINNMATQRIILEAISEKPLKTSSINPGLIEEKVMELLKTYDHVLYFPIAYNLSKQYENALPLLESPNLHKRLTIVKHYFTGIQLSAFIGNLLKFLNVPGIINEIDLYIKMWEQSSILFVVPGDLKILARGGRVNKLLGNIAYGVRIKVGIAWSDEPRRVALVFTYSQIINSIIKDIEKMKDKEDWEGYQVYLACTIQCDSKILQTITSIFKNNNINLKIVHLPTVFATHGGVNTLGVCAIKKNYKLK